MNRWKVFGAFALVAMLAFGAVQRSAISRTRIANETLRQQIDVPSGAATDGAAISTEEIEVLESANRELPKLRNEVRKLREEKRELERLQTENERLSTSLKAAPKTTAPPLSERKVLS